MKFFVLGCISGREESNRATFRSPKKCNPGDVMSCKNLYQQWKTLRRRICLSLSGNTIHRSKNYLNQTHILDELALVVFNDIRCHNPFPG